MNYRGIGCYTLRLLLLTGAVLLSNVVSAASEAGLADYSRLSDEQFETVLLIKNLFAEVEGYQSEGLLSDEQAIAVRSYILLRQKSFMENPLSIDQLQLLADSCVNDIDCRKKSILDHFSGIFSFINIIWFISSVLIVIGVVLVLLNYKSTIYKIFNPLKILFKHVFRFAGNILGFIIPEIGRILRLAPSLFYELLALSISLCIVYFARYTSDASQAYNALIGNLFVMLMISMIYRRRRKAFASFLQGLMPTIKFNPESFVMLFSAVVWIASTLMYESQLLGFFAVAIILMWLGFGFVVSPLVYSIGFKDRTSIIRGTIGASLLLLLYIVVTINNITLPYYVNFSTGIQYLGSIVFYTGILILSARTVANYYAFNYPLMQVLAITVGVATLLVGSVYEMHVMRGIGGSFFALFLLEKQFEYPWNKKRAAWLLLLVGLSLYMLAYVVSEYPEYFFLSQMA